MSKSYVNLQNGSDVIGSLVSGSCAKNKAIYKASGEKPGGSLFIGDFIPLKAPCNYGIEVYMTLIDTNGAICSYRQWDNINQLVAGGAISLNPAAAFITQSFGGTALAITKNATKDSLNFNWTLAGNFTTYKYYVEVVVTNPIDF